MWVRDYGYGVVLHVHVFESCPLNSLHKLSSQFFSKAVLSIVFKKAVLLILLKAVFSILFKRFLLDFLRMMPSKFSLKAVLSILFYRKAVISIIFKAVLSIIFKAVLSILFKSCPLKILFKNCPLYSLLKLSSQFHRILSSQFSSKARLLILITSYPLSYF